MSLGLRLELRQSQGLVMTPQLQQAIKLLQLSNLELAGYVERELEENPFLERQDGAADAAEGDGGAEEPAARPAGEELSGALAMPSAPDDPRAEGDGDDGWHESVAEPAHEGLTLDGYGADGFAGIGRGGGGGGADMDGDGPGLEARLTRAKTLRDHLVEQLQLDLSDDLDRLIGMHLIDLVDDAGYLTGDPDEVAGRLGCPRERLDSVLGRLQQFDPPGVFARSLGECLALQLREANRLDPAMQALLGRLDLLAQADFPALLRLCRVEPDDLGEMIAEIKALNPKPGLAFAQDPIEPVVPDIFVLPLRNGDWRVELNGATLPKVLANTSYYARVSKGAADKRAREYFSERYQSATWLVKALDQRARTVLKVAEAVVARQLPFLQRGVQHLRPLVLRDIAEATGLHESTVSRATADKYIGTPRGNFPFKYFFTNALPGTGGGMTHGAEAIRQQIKAMIERETADSVLSDDQIVDALRAEGVVIARRTVAKYRESLHIPSSVQRRRARALRLC
ncbi:MAG TPA: RNA polymerase factor sigma-54 [Geminicoccaceae bacterium]|nr:RNA polymerase factor sigma-54 [Geminicoccaceae bacterium]